MGTSYVHDDQTVDIELGLIQLRFVWLFTVIAAKLNSFSKFDHSMRRIHTLGLANRSKTHPDSRAILFEDVTYR